MQPTMNCAVDATENAAVNTIPTAEGQLVHKDYINLTTNESSRITMTKISDSYCTGGRGWKDRGTREATNHWTEGGRPPVEGKGWGPGRGIAAGSFR